MRRRARYRLRRQLRSLLPVLALALPVVVGAYVLSALRLTADALVVTAPVVARAPSAVRVVEVLCAPGDARRAGDPLVRLGPIGQDAEGLRLATRVESKRLRLELLAAGGRVDVAGRWEAPDLALEAERESQLAEADLGVLEAELTRLVRLRERRAVELRDEQEARAGVVTELVERLSAAQASQRVAETTLRPAELDARNSERLHAEGIVPDREVEVRRADHDAARFEVDERALEARALARRLETAETQATLGKELNTAMLAELDAELAAAEREVEAGLRRAELWRQAEIYYREKRVGTTLPVEEQRVYELALLGADLREAEAALVAHDEARGAVILYAELDGVVDRVAVRAGSVVEAGAELVSYYDPTALDVVAYASPRLAGRLAPGTGVRLVPHGGGDVLEAELATVGQAWVRCPPQLPVSDQPGADLRLPLVVACDAAELRPGMRLRARFQDRRGTLPRRVASWLGL